MATFIERTLRVCTVLIGCIALLMLLPTTAWSQVITVTTTDGGAVSADGDCSLREAIQNANDNAMTNADCATGVGALDVIEFTIPDADPGCVGTASEKVCTIVLASSLPPITDPVTIDGYSQLGADVNTATLCSNADLKILLDGSGLGTGPSSHGLRLRAASTVKGLVIHGFGRDGIFINAAGNGSTVEGNFLGTDGTSDLGNRRFGVTMERSTGNLIGGTTLDARNIISGNASDGVRIRFVESTDNLVQGNCIGTNAAGTAAIANGGPGVRIFGDATSNTVGVEPSPANAPKAAALSAVPSSCTGACNVISGNGTEGVRIQNGGSTGNTISGNLIGTNATGTSAMGNGTDGVHINAADNTVGGTAAGEGNVISSNGGNGIRIVNGGATGILVQGNFIGTDITGTVDRGNGISGVAFATSAGGGHTIGGTTGTTPGGSCTGACNLISGNTNAGINFASAGSSSGAPSFVVGNYIGTDVTGTMDLGNTGIGVAIQGVESVTVGGTTPAERNIISGNDAGFGGGILIQGGAAATGNVITGNYIGTDVTGNVDLGNTRHGVFINNAPANTVGMPPAPGNALKVGAPPGTCTGACNVISGNGDNGVIITGADAPSNVVQGNYIGTDVDGEITIGNGRSGVRITQNELNEIGGMAAGEGNLISGNGINGATDDQNGVRIDGTDATGNVVQGNYIGTDITGTIDLGNRQRGVMVHDGASSNTIGATPGPFAAAKTASLGGPPATCTGACNLISGNDIAGVLIQNSGSDDNTVVGNYIGTALNGTDGLGNGRFGVIINRGSTNTIGGSGTDEGNLISANGDGSNVGAVEIFHADATGNVVQGNYIGTDVGGTMDLGNTSHGVFLRAGTSANTIGGTASGQGNLISANGRNGIQINASTTTGNLIQGNFIGTDVTGTMGLGNTSHGVQMDDAASNTVGAELGPFAAAKTVSLGGPPAACTGACNLISSNGGSGVVIRLASSGNVVLGNYIGTALNGTDGLGNAVQGVIINDGTMNTVGGPLTDEGNLISANGKNGVVLFGGSDNTVQGNYIGTDVTGSADLGNVQIGVHINVGTTSNLIGGTASGAGNLISGNDFSGILIGGTGTSDMMVQGNYIGTAANGTSPLGNTNWGIAIFDGAFSNTVGGTASGAGNIIAFNGLDGVLVRDDDLDGSTVGNAILSNAIFENGGIGIDLTNRAPVPGTDTHDGPTFNDPGDADGSPNRLQNYPIITAFELSGGDLMVTYGVDTDPLHATYPLRVEFFSADSDEEEGKTLLGFDTYTAGNFATGEKTVNLGALALPTVIVGTATDDEGNTSEFTVLGPPSVMTVKMDAVVVDTYGDAGADPGDEIEYTVTLENTGDAAAEGVIFTDTVDPNTTLLCGSVSTSLGSYSCSGGTLTVNVGTIYGQGSPDDTATITFSVVVNDPFPDQVTYVSNQATVSGDNIAEHLSDDPDTGAPYDPTVTPINYADLSLHKQVTALNQHEGTLTAHFAITVTNNGPNTATDVEVTDDFPEELTLLSATPSQGGYVSATGVWTVGTLADGAEATLVLRVTGPEQANVVNFAEITNARQPDTNLPNNIAAALVGREDASRERFRADVSLLKSVDDTSPSVGNEVVYTLVVRNDGPLATANVEVIDVLPSGVEWVSSEVSDASDTYDATTGVWVVGALRTDSTATLMIRVRIMEAGEITNTAEVTRSTMPDLDSSPGNGLAVEDDQASATLTASAAQARIEEGAGRLALESNYPNPFNPETVIPYVVPEATEVRIAVYDVLGREVALLVEGTVAAGRYEVVFTASQLPTGMYLVRMEVGAEVLTRRVTLMK